MGGEIERQREIEDPIEELRKKEWREKGKRNLERREKRRAAEGEKRERKRKKELSIDEN